MLFQSYNYFYKLISSNQQEKCKFVEKLEMQTFHNLNKRVQIKTEAEQAKDKI